ncbi:MAG: cupredoxin domain-containing protein [Gaiellaceae bacterium]
MNTKRRLILGAVAALALVLAAPASTAPTATATVQIVKTGFVPATVSINAGDSVTWRNADTKTHQVVANGGQFASAVLNPGQTYSHTFDRGATYRYHDALHPTLKGTVNVKGLPPSVTLVASAPVVKYGAQVTLSGAVSNKKSGETVTLVALQTGQTNKEVIATLQTTTNGAFSFAVTPQIGTTYQAQWKSTESSVIVQVAPMIKLPAPTRSGYFHFYVTAATSFAGHFVYLQRFTLLRTWVNMSTLTLGSKSGRLISIRSVRRLVPHGRWSVRVFIPQDQVGTGYLETFSGSQPVVRR